MKYGLEREISKEVFDKCETRGNLKTLSKEDYGKVFKSSEICGYGVYNERVIEKDGKYFVKFDLGDNCD